MVIIIILWFSIAWELYWFPVTDDKRENPWCTMRLAWDFWDTDCLSGRSMWISVAFYFLFCNVVAYYQTNSAGFIILTPFSFSSPSSLQHVDGTQIRWSQSILLSNSPLHSPFNHSWPQELLHNSQHRLPEELAAYQDGSGRGQWTRQWRLQFELPGGYWAFASPHHPSTQFGRYQGEAHRVRLQACHRRQICLRWPEVRCNR